MRHPETFPLQGRRIWVTGGNGFLGRAVVARLQAASDELASPAVKQAQADVDAYFARICPAPGSLGSVPPAAASR